MGEANSVLLSNPDLSSRGISSEAEFDIPPRSTFCLLRRRFRSQVLSGIRVVKSLRTTSFAGDCPILRKLSICLARARLSWSRTSTSLASRVKAAICRLTR